MQCGSPLLAGVAATDVQQLLEQRGQALILEITTGGDYTDLADSPKRHLEQLEGLLGRALAMKPLKINLIIGDSWPEAAQHCFFEAVLDHIDAVPCAVMLEPIAAGAWPTPGPCRCGWSVIPGCGSRLT